MLQYSLRYAAEQAIEQAAEIQRLYDDLIREAAERATAEKQLCQAQKMEAVGNMIGGLAHDFNNLLGVIVADLDLLVTRADGQPEVTELAGEAMEAALKGADLTQRLLTYARCQPLAPKTLDINEAIRNVFRLLSRTLGEDIEVDLALSSTPLSVFADPAQLEASMTNLAANARDAMPRGGRLSVTTSVCHFDGGNSGDSSHLAVGEYVLIEVTDTGEGIPQELQGQIFEPYFTTKEAGRGTGLGLAIVFGFIKQSGGRITVESDVGTGTTFRMFLPRTSALPEIETEVAKATVRRGGETVLVVEDNTAMRRVASRQLSDLGYRVLQAENASAALEILGREPVDLLFSDIVMPGKMDGFALMETAQARWPSLKVLLISGYIGNAAAARNSTNTRLLTKPYRQDELAKILREILDA